MKTWARPAIDRLFRSAAASYGAAVVGVVLTGQLDDGTAGLLSIKDGGGFTIVQEPSEATAHSMPLNAIRQVNVDEVGVLEETTPQLVQLARDDPPEAEPSLQKPVEVEYRIAEGIFSVEDWWALEAMSVPSGLNCPNCRSALYELKGRRVLRFRCWSGDAFCSESGERSGGCSRSSFVVVVRSTD